MMDRHFATLQEHLQDDPALKHVHLVTVSFDPAVDTPPVLKKHARELKADLTRWTFLTGERDDIDSSPPGSACRVVAGAERRARHHAQPPHGHRLGRGQARQGVHGQRVDAGGDPRGPEARRERATRNRSVTAGHFRTRRARRRSRACARRSRCSATSTGCRTTTSRAGAPRCAASGASSRTAAPIVWRPRSLPTVVLEQHGYPPLRPELRVDRRARSRDLRLPAARPMGIGRAVARSGPARPQAGLRHAAARSRSATRIRTSTSPAASPATRSSTWRSEMGDYDWRLAGHQRVEGRTDAARLPAPRDSISRTRASNRLRARYRAVQDGASGPETALVSAGADRWTELPASWECDGELR